MKYRNPRGQLGRALTILKLCDVGEQTMHADVAAFGAPSECHSLVSKGEARRWRQAYRHACAVSGLKRREFAAVFCAVPSRIWWRLDAEMNCKHNPFYGRN